MRKPPLPLKLISASLLLFLTYGCSETVIYNRSVGDLNAKAQALLTQGDLDGAIGRLQSALDLSPNEPSTLYNLGIAYQAKGDLDHSIAYLEKVVALPAAQVPAAAYQSLAAVYEEKGDQLIEKVAPSTEADSVAKPKPATSKESLAALKTQAMALYTKAQEILEKGTQLFPESKAMKEHLPVLKAKIERQIQKLSIGFSREMSV